MYTLLQCGIPFLNKVKVDVNILMWYSRSSVACTPLGLCPPHPNTLMEMSAHILQPTTYWKDCGLLIPANSDNVPIIDDGTYIDFSTSRDLSHDYVLVLIDGDKPSPGHLPLIPYIQHITIL